MPNIDILFSETYKNNPRSLFILRKLCKEQGIEGLSLRQACHDLNIGLSLDKRGQICVSIPDHILTNEWLLRGRLEQEILDYEEEIERFLKGAYEQEQTPNIVTPSTLSNRNDFSLKEEVEEVKEDRHPDISKPEISSNLTYAKWQGAFNHLIHRPYPSNFPQDKWAILIKQLKHFMSSDCPHISNFIKHKYSLLEVFGCHPVKPYERYDYRGVIVALANSNLSIEEVLEDKVVFKTSGGATQTLRRKVQIPLNSITLLD